MAAPVVLYLVNRSIIKRKRKKIVEAIVQPTKDGASAYLQFRF